MSKYPLPEKRYISCRGEQERCKISVDIKVVTPILGGAAGTREIDVLDVIRTSTIRGHLRFWWRALYGHKYPTSSQLYAKESELWGKAANEKGGRSLVRIAIDNKNPSKVDDSDIQPGRTSGSYALWTARATNTGEPLAPRREAGTSFVLTVTAPTDREVEVKNTIRAWIIFGGYGSRTRRGLGSLTVTQNSADFLPMTAELDSFESLFGFNLFQSVSDTSTDCPSLSGASLFVGPELAQPETAWIEALDWLKNFRQGTYGQEGQRAREPGTPPSRPSRSNWPEPDKIRHLKRKTTAHNPRYNSIPVWPRASFGLPINGQFQKNSRDGNRRLDEPEPYKIKWKPSGKSEACNRLASPVIFKALPLSSGRFLPCVLWFNRAYPSGEVGLANSENSIQPASCAPFDKLLAPGDQAKFAPLEAPNMRTAFLSWLRKNQVRVKVTAP